jgi:hypothetical protein
MTIDKSALKRQIDQSRPNELIVLAVNKLEKNSLKICQKEIEKIIKKEEDYTVILMKF